MSILFDPEKIAEYRTYVMGKDAYLLAAIKPLPSSFRVNWRILEIDGFHWHHYFNFDVLDRQSVKYNFTLEKA